LLLCGAAQAQQLAPPTAYTPWTASPPVTATPTSRFATARQQSNMGQQKSPAPPIGGVRSPEMALDSDQPAAPYTIQLEAPSIERVGRSVESDAQLQERIRQENRERKVPERITFPNDPVISTEIYNGRKWFPKKLEVAPYYVCHGRLYFQQINFERYGWELGVFQPLISAGVFLYDFVFWPYHLATEPLRCYEYNTGWCLPGDPVPLLLYPLHPSPTGFVAEVGTILTLVAVFP
jgi:hypothetical protein